MTGADLVALFKKHPIGFGCLLVALLCGGWGYYRGMAIESLTTEANDTADKASKILDNVRNASGLREQASEMTAAANALEARAVRASQLALNLQYFYKLESESSIRLIDVRQQGGGAQGGRPINNTPYLGVPFSVSVEGPYADVLKVIDRLTKGTHLCRFLNVTFNKSTGGGASGTPGPANAIIVSANLELFGMP